MPSATANTPTPPRLRWPPIRVPPASQRSRGPQPRRALHLQWEPHSRSTLRWPNANPLTVSAHTACDTTPHPTHGPPPRHARRMARCHATPNPPYPRPKVTGKAVSYAFDPATLQPRTHLPRGQAPTLHDWSARCAAHDPARPVQPGGRCPVPPPSPPTPPHLPQPLTHVHQTILALTRPAALSHPPFATWLRPRPHRTCAVRWEMPSATAGDTDATTPPATASTVPPSHSRAHKAHSLAAPSVRGPARGTRPHQTCAV